MIVATAATVGDESMSITIGVKPDEEIRDRLKSLGTARQRSTHWLMREAIREYLEREEAIETRNREADEAWADYKRSGKFVSHETMTSWLDTWGTDQESHAPETKR
jgi:predicted transcriptional regulator